METHRNHSLEKGAKYCVKQTVESRTSIFTKGEIVIFETTGYSIYDSSSSFIFCSIDHDVKKAFYLDDDEPDLTLEVFQKLN